MITAEECVATDTACISPVASCHRGGVEVIDRWANDWRNLCDDAIDDQPFYRPEWITAHVRAFAPKAAVVLLTVHIDAQLCLVLPLLEERSLFCGVPVRKLRAPVNGHSCRFDAVRRRGIDGYPGVEALWHCLRQLSAWDVLEFEGVPVGGTVSAVARIAERNGFQTGHIAMSPNPYVPIPPANEGLSQLPLNTRLRTQLRTVHRDIAAKGDLRLRRISFADRAVLDRFYGFESAGWKGAEKTAIACSTQAQRFYDEIAHSAEQFGYLSIYLLELNDQLLAAHFGLSYQGRYFSPKVAYNENLGKWAPGHLIVDEILRDCVERGIYEYDITGQNDEWKRKWTNQTREQCTQYIFSKGPSGRLAHFARFRAKPWLRDALNPWLRGIARTK